MKKQNAWKKYGALLLAGVLLAGFADDGTLRRGVFAEEDQPLTLSIADQEDDEEESGSAPEEIKESKKETTLKIADAEDPVTVTEESGVSGIGNALLQETEAPETEMALKEETPKTEEAELLTEENTEEPQETEEKSYAQIGAVDIEDISIVTTDVSEIVENCMASIVSITNISVEEVQTYYYGVQEYQTEGAASGIIVAQNDTELLIATNSHVVEDTVELSVGFTVDAENPEDLIVPAKIKGMDKSYELAVIAVQLSDIPENIYGQLKIATLGSSDKLKVGEAAIAIGNALGYGQSVTSGIISALNREISIDNFTNEVIMTDAAINFGNSGGALLNAKGQVIGINVAKEAGSSAESMGYSIPIDTAIPILQRLINKETREQLDDTNRGYMGATVVNVTDDAKELYNMPQGAFVYEVTKGSAAEKAGIKKGDVITRFDGESVTGSDDLIEKMRYFGVGETVTLEVQTANGGSYEAREVEVTLQQGTATASTSSSEKEDDSQDNEEDWNEEFDEGWNDEFEDWSGSFQNSPFGNGFY